MTLAIPDSLTLEGRSLEELTEIIHAEHDRVEFEIGRLRDVFNGACAHAIIAGEALLQAKRLVPGGWREWCAANVRFTKGTISTYMRLAQYRVQVEEWVASGGNGSINGARGVISELPNLPRWYMHTVQMQEEAKRRKREGESIRSIANDLGVTWITVREWTDPAYRKRRQAKKDEQRRRREAERKALRQQERERRARKLGGAAAEAYANVRKALAATDRAMDEAAEPDTRENLRLALTSLHRAEDRLVAALRLDRRA